MADDDASSAVRQAALKFADQNEDGPLDLVMNTGKYAPAKDAKSYIKVLSLTKEADLRNLCHKNPHL